MRAVTLRLLKPPPCGVVMGAANEDLGAAQRFPGFGVNARAVAAEINLFADFNGLDREFRAGRLNDLERGVHYFRTNAVAVRNCNRYFAHCKRGEGLGYHPVFAMRRRVL